MLEVSKLTLKLMDQISIMAPGKYVLTSHDSFMQYALLCQTDQYNIHHDNNTHLFGKTIEMDDALNHVPLQIYKLYYLILELFRFQCH